MCVFTVSAERPGGEQTESGLNVNIIYICVTGFNTEKIALVILSGGE